MKKDAKNPAPEGNPKGPLSVEEASQGLYGLLSEDPEFAEEQEDGGSPEEHDDSSEDVVDDEEDLGDDVEFDEDEDDDEGEEALEDESDDEDPELHTVRVDGEELEVTYDELLAGYSRQADYTRKTQALSEERKALGEEKSQTAERRQEYARRLELVAQTLEEMTPEEPDWQALQKEDPQKYLLMRDQWSQLQERQRQVAAERQRVAKEQQEELERQYQEYLNGQLSRLQEVIPEWKDEQKRKAELSELKSYAIDRAGLSLEEVNQLSDHRLLVALRKAKLYDDLMEKGGDKLRKKKERAQKLRPGKRQNRQRVRRKKKEEAVAERFAKSRHVRDAASVIAIGLEAEDAST